MNAARRYVEGVQRNVPYSKLKQKLESTLYIFSKEITNILTYYYSLVVKNTIEFLKFTNEHIILSFLLLI